MTLEERTRADINDCHWDGNFQRLGRRTHGGAALYCTMFFGLGQRQPVECPYKMDEVVYMRPNNVGYWRCNNAQLHIKLRKEGKI
jgi:hypothetical protein